VDRRLEPVVLERLGRELARADLVRCGSSGPSERVRPHRHQDERERHRRDHHRPRPALTRDDGNRRGITRRGKAHERCGRVDQLRRDPNDRHRLGESLQLERSAILVADAVHPPGEVRDLTRGEHLAGTRLAAQPRREVQRAAPVAGLDGHGLPGVEADPDRQEHVGVGDRLGYEALLEVERGADRLARR
jgi:hypothetical protein